MITYLLKQPRTILGVLVVATILSAGAYAFTAANTVSASTAGSGTGTVSGYQATNIGYSLNATDPTKVDTVTFTLNPTTASQLQVKVGSTGTWKTDCTNSGGSVSCDYSASPVDLQGIDEIDVVAVS